MPSMKVRVRALVPRLNSAAFPPGKVDSTMLVVLPSMVLSNPALRSERKGLG